MSLTNTLLDPTRPQDRSRRVPGIRRRARRPETVVGHAEVARPGLEYVLFDGLRPSSELDEARRRVKRNVQEIEGQLRLGGRRGEAESTEALLTDMTRKVQSMAAYERTICRSGQFEEVDLAICLRQAANFLSRPHGRSPEPENGSAGGWAFADSGATLSWTRGFRGETDSRDPVGMDLGDAIRFLAPRWREPARRAVCACAVMFPPGPINWRSWFGADQTDDTARPGDLGIRLRPAADHLQIEIWVAEGSLGLPRSFGEEGKVALERQIARRLLTQSQETQPGGSDPVVFEVRFLSALPGHHAGALMQMEACLSRP